MPTRSPYWDYTELEPIRVQFQVEQVDVDNLREHLEVQTKQMHETIAAGRRAYLIIVANGEYKVPPEVRKLQAEWLEEHRDSIARNTVAMSFVIDNALVRGALTAIFWVTGPPVPHKVHSTLAEAITHAISACRKEGLELPPEALRPDAAARAELALQRMLSYRVAL